MIYDSSKNNMKRILLFGVISLLLPFSGCMMDVPDDVAFPIIFIRGDVQSFNQSGHLYYVTLVNASNAIADDWKISPIITIQMGEHNWRDDIKIGSHIQCRCSKTAYKETGKWEFIGWDYVEG